MDVAGAHVTGPRRRVAVIGDVGGHGQALREELVRLGADPDTGTLPADLTVIQVGDLVHRGPDSAGVVGLVDHFLARRPDQWIQLVGNHEAQYLRDPAFAWGERLDTGTVATLRRWWGEGRLRVAAAITGDREDYLVTTPAHRGPLARRSRRARRGARPRGLNGSRASGTTCCSGRPDAERAPTRACAGPLWASARGEAVASWLGVPLPFSRSTATPRSSTGGPPERRRRPRHHDLRPDARHETSTPTAAGSSASTPDTARRGGWRAWQAEDVGGQL
jgi:hypothetical protein